MTKLALRPIYMEIIEQVQAIKWSNPGLMRYYIQIP